MGHSCSASRSLDQSCGIDLRSEEGSATSTGGDPPWPSLPLRRRYCTAAAAATAAVAATAAAAAAAAMLALRLLPHSLLLPPLPASGDRDGLRTSHAVSDSSHWVVPGLLLQGDGSPQAKGEAFKVGSLENMDTLSAAVDAIEQRFRASEALYVCGASASDEGQAAALACACTLGLLYEMSAEEAFARVKGYGSGLRKPPVDLARIDAELVQKFIRKARASNCADR